MTDYTISCKLSNETVYAYYRGRFWHWNGSIWKESRIMTHRFELAKAADKKLTPPEFLSNGAEFAPLDEYEIDSAMLDALENAKPCKNAPIEPVKEDPTPSAQCSDAATAAESQTAASPAVPEGSSPTMETAPAVPSAAAPASADEESAALSAGSGSSLSNPAAPTFDYSCLPNNLCTVIRANTTEFSRHMNRSVQEYGEACINVMNVNAALAERYTGRWAQWCTSVGLSVRSATRMVEVGKSILGSAKLAELVQDGQIGKSLLQAICAPSADATAVGQVLSGNITTHKEYQDLLKENQQLRTDRVEAMNQADRERARADRAEAERDKARADQLSTAKDCNRLGLKASQEKDRADKAEARAKDAENQLAGSRQVAEAAKLRGDKLKAENDALKSQPITAVVDKEEVERQAREIAAEMTAELRAQLEQASSGSEQDAHSSYDNVLLADRSFQNIGKMVVPSLRRLPPEQREQLTNMLVHTLGQIQGEVSRCL